MTDKRRLVIIVLSVLFGTVISAGLFFLRRGGNLGQTDYNSIITNLVFSLAIVIFIGIFLIKPKKDKKL